MLHIHFKYKEALILIIGITFSKSHAVSNLCYQLFQNKISISPIESLSVIRDKKSDLLESIKYKQKLIDYIYKSLQFADSNKKQFDIQKREIPGDQRYTFLKNAKDEGFNLDPRFVTTIKEWIRNEVPNSFELPQNIYKELPELLKINDLNVLLNKINTTDFEFLNESQIYSFLKIFNSFELSNGFTQKIIDLIYHKMKNKVGSSLGHSLEVNILLRLNETIKTYSSIKNDDKVLYELFPKIFDWNILQEFNLRDTNELNRVFYYSFRILQLETLRITELEQQINKLKKSELAKTQEQTLLKNGIELNKIKVNGVDYSEFHHETAVAFLHIVSNLGIEYGRFISNPGVQNRPLAFIRDVKEIQKQGLSDPEQIWNELRKKTYTLYRKLSLPENIKDDILKNGMDSNFLRMKGNTYKLTADILKNGLNTYITNHIINARTQNSTMLSTTFSQDSATALSIAQQYSGYAKDNDVHTFSLNVPIYDIIIANNLSNQSKLYEILVWNQVKPDRISCIKSESPVTVDIESLRADRSSLGNLPDTLQEPE